MAPYVRCLADEARANIDCEKPCGAKTCSIFASSEPQRPENTKPSSSIGNYRTVLAMVDGWEDLARLPAVEVGGARR